MHTGREFTFLGKLKTLPIPEICDFRESFRNNFKQLTKSVNFGTIFGYVVAWKVVSGTENDPGI